MQKQRDYLAALSTTRQTRSKNCLGCAELSSGDLWEKQLPNPQFGSLLLVFTPRTGRGRGGMLRAKNQAFLSTPGLAIWDGCQLEGSVAAEVIASLGTATGAAAVLAWDCSCWYVSSIQLCFPEEFCQLWVTARSLNHTPGSSKVAQMLGDHTVVSYAIQGFHLWP